MPISSKLIYSFRQAKTAAAQERGATGLVEFAAYEASLEENLQSLQRRILDPATPWFSNVELGSVVVIPKKLSSVRRARPSNVISIGHMVPDRALLEVRIQLQCSPEFMTLEALYLSIFGGYLEELLSPNCLANRIKRDRHRRPRTKARDLFQYWPAAYEKYKRTPVDEALQILERGAKATIVSLDFQAYYDQLSPRFLLDDGFIQQVVARSSDFPVEEYKTATSTLLGKYEEFYALRQRFAPKAAMLGVPIGALTSRIIANLALAQLDQTLSAGRTITSVVRYVDDIAVVAESSSKPTSSQALLSELYPGLFEHDRGHINLKILNPGLESVQHLRVHRDKLRVHWLSGETGRAFLGSVRESFDTLSSERRAFVSDLPRLIRKIDLFSINDKSDRGDLSVLKDADRFILKRYASSIAVRSLERQVRLLGSSGSSGSLEEHAPRLIDAMADNHRICEFEFHLRILRVAIMARNEPLSQKCARAIGGLLSPSSVLLGISSLVWNGQKLSKAKVKDALAGYLKLRLQEALAAWIPREASSASNAVASELGLVISEIQEAARTLSNADLRHLDRQEDLEVLGYVGEATKGFPEVEADFAGTDPSEAATLAAVEDFKAHLPTSSPWNTDTLRLFLSTKPPTYYDISAAFLSDAWSGSGSHGSNLPERILAAVNALRDTQYFEPPAQLDDQTIILPGHRSHKETLLILGNLVLKDAWASDALDGRFSPTAQRADALFDMIKNASAEASRNPGKFAVLVLPELGVPRRWVRAIAFYLSRLGNISTIMGLEYQLLSLANSRSQVENQALGIFQLGWKSILPVVWSKRNPAHIETQNVSFPPRSGRRHTVVGPFGRLGVLICSELLESDAINDYRGRIEHLIVPAWNPDTETFDHLVKSAGMFLHSFVSVANNGKYSDCRSWAPVAEPRFEREVARLVQRNINTVALAFVDTRDLYLFRSQERVYPEKVVKKSRVWKPLPPNWVIVKK